MRRSSSAISPTLSFLRSSNRTVVEYRVAGDVIEVPMAEHRGEFPNSQFLEITAHEFRVRHAGEGIVDNGLRVAMDSVHGRAELQGGIIEPIPLLEMALGLIPAGVEGDQIVIVVMEFDVRRGLGHRSRLSLDGGLRLSANKRLAAIPCAIWPFAGPDSSRSTAARGCAECASLRRSARCSRP